MAQHSGIVGQEHTQARSHKRPIRFVGGDTTPAALKYFGAALGWSNPPATLRAAAGFEVVGPLETEATYRLCTVGALPVAVARIGMRIDRSLLLEP
jgi:hypothetical protein